MKFIWVTGLSLFLACATGHQPTTAQPEAVPSHVYPLPLDNVLAQTTTLLEQKGWRVKRVGSALVTNWQGSDEGSLVTYRVHGERIDAGFCTLSVERVVATPVQFILDHSKTARPWFQKDPPPYPTEFEENPHDVGAVGTAPPTTMAVTQRVRDAALESELELGIDPPTLGTGHPGAPSLVPAPEALADRAASPGPLSTSSPLDIETKARSAGLTETPLKALAGVWEGIFNFRGNVVGSYAGEIAVAVDDGSAEVSDFCPESGGTITAKGSGSLASWQGELACPPIRLRGCASTVIKYTFANAMLQDGTLRLVAAGTVDTPAGCGDTSGALSVTFEASRAHYVYLTVTRTSERTTCTWPSDWEDLGSTGSMAMPDPSMESKAFLGIIRAKGVRLSQIQTLLQHCQHRLDLHGVPVLMRMAVTGPHHATLH